MSKKKKTKFLTRVTSKRGKRKWKCSKWVSDRKKRERDTARRLSGVVGVCVMKEKNLCAQDTIKSSEFSPLLLGGCSS